MMNPENTTETASGPLSQQAVASVQASLEQDAVGTLKQLVDDMQPAHRALLLQQLHSNMPDALRAELYSEKYIDGLFEAADTDGDKNQLNK